MVKKAAAAALRSAGTGLRRRNCPVLRRIRRTARNSCWKTRAFFARIRSKGGSLYEKTYAPRFTKFTALLLSLCLLVGLLPITAFAYGKGSKASPTKAHVKEVYSEAVETAGADSQICAATVRDESGDFVLRYVYSSDCIWNVQLFNRVRGGLAEPYKSLIPVLEEDDDSKKGFLFLSDDQYKDMDLNWADPAAVAEALVPGSGTVSTEDITSSVFSSDSADIIDEYCSDYNENTVETINETGESITRR